MAIIVRFTDVENFIAEVSEERYALENDLVRTSSLWDIQQPTTKVYLLAGAVVNGRLLELRHKIGSGMLDHDSKRLHKELDTAREKLTRTLEQMGMKVRPGFFAIMENTPK